MACFSTAFWIYNDGNVITPKISFKPVSVKRKLQTADRGKIQTEVII